MEPRLAATARGSRRGSFGATEWSLLASTAAMWGSAPLLIAVGLESLEPAAITAVRIALGTAALALVPAARRVRIERADWARVAALGVLWLALPLTLYPIAQQWVDSSTAGMITGAQPLFAALVASLLLRARPGGVQVVGLAVGFAGVVAVSWASAAGGTSSQLAGVVLILVAVACYAVATNLAVPVQQRYGSLPVVLRALLVAAAASVPLAVVAAARGGAAAPSAAGAFAMVLLGVCSTGLGFVVFASLVGRAGATRGAVAIYFVPLVALVLGVAVRGDPVRPLALAGVSLVVAGAWLTSRAEPAA